MRAETVWTTRALCDALAERKKLNTDYQLAKYMSVAQSAVSAWRKGARFMSDEWAERFAVELELDPAYVCLCLAPERSTHAKLAGQMRAWLTAHATAASVFYAVISGLFMLSVPAQSHAAAEALRGGLCILCKIAERLRRPDLTLWHRRATLDRSSISSPALMPVCAHG